MKSLLRSLFGWPAKHPAKPNADVPLYEYPNDRDATMEEAVASIWKWYVQLGKQVQICVQGMGGTLDQYHIENAVFKNSVLSWENAADSDCMEIHSEDQFQRCFLDWVKKRMKPFSDTGEFAFGIERGFDC